jgi:UDP-N-acetylglucosamine pyrophosphorylase
MRGEFKTQVNFMLMNSFNTSNDTLTFLQKYPELVNDPKIELMQNKVPKIVKSTLEPAAWTANPHLEWCPPGHGDLYSSLYGSGKLDALLSEGVKYMFVSNSDNLGATLDTGTSLHAVVNLFPCLTLSTILHCRFASVLCQLGHAFPNGVLHSHRSR